MGEIAIAELGLVGCGGAGFPTHVKLAAQNVDHLIVNAAECEPLLHKDKEILKHAADEFFKGLIRAIDLTGAKHAHIAMKRKYADLLEALEKAIPDKRISMLPLGDFYPSGDEYELVYEASGRLIPFGGIPLHVGCVVSNVETLLNLGRNRPVTTKILSLAGAVPNPMTVEVPVGITVFEALSLSGLKSLAGLTVIDGGPMMGRLVRDPQTDVVTKTTGGLIALPSDHPLIRRMATSDAHNKQIARSACDQCTDCSELCPRALLGYPIRPHKAMRTAQLAPFNDQNYSRDAIFCSECGLCSLFSCPEALPPREMCQMAKRHHLSHGIKPTDWKDAPQVHPMRGQRRVGIERLIKRLGLLDYDHKSPWTEIRTRFERVRLPLKMHVGVPVEPLVRPGDMVKLGQLIGAVPDKKLGAPLHASISGRIESVDSASIVISRA
ncbi:MAG TPA: 4Fe-4S dicluster domain-containing protein [Candidatus Ozemobacteraceae bacterium]|nr:4Fe-4S dicluster domain-containing protein [Candidatus Ozemobacteraceae bacterium]